MSTANDFPDLEQLPDARSAIAADMSGRLLTTTGEQVEGARCASCTASTLRELEAVASDAGLGVPVSLVIRGRDLTTVTAVRGAVFVQAVLDAAQGTAQLERALGAWDPGAPLGATVGGAGGDGQDEGLAVEEERPADEVGPDAAVGAVDLASSLRTAAARAAVRADAWMSLRRALVRGQLTDASAHREALARDPGGEAAGAEALDAAQRERAMDALLEGIGSVLSGDAKTGLRTLAEVASEAQANLSFRWLALHWSALAAVQCSDSAAARGCARQAVQLSRTLDAEAQAVSQWAAAEVLVAEGNGARALDWVAQSRVRFERLGDTWGLGRACFAEARILAAMEREDEANEAARRAWSYDPVWDEPPVFLARRALARGAVEEAEETVRMVPTAHGERIRLTAQAVRLGALAQADAVELLRYLHAAPSADAVRALERLAQAAPRLPVPREALAWMLLKAGKYADAGRHFTALAASRLPPTIRSSVMLGLGCVAHAQRTGERPEVRLRAAVEAGGAGAPAPAEVESASTAPALSSSIALAPGAVFSGKLSVFAVPDLLEFLRGARRTGLLLCSDAAGTAALHFRDGRIVGAASPSTPNVGDLLIRAGKLSAQALQAFVARQDGRARTDGVLGELLVREGRVGAEDVRRALREQIGLAVRELIGWREGEFAFNREEPQAEAEIPVEVDPQEVLLNALKELDEASRGTARP